MDIVSIDLASGTFTSAQEHGQAMWGPRGPLSRRAPIKPNPPGGPVGLPHLGSLTSSELSRIYELQFSVAPIAGRKLIR